ncbi:chitin binding domain-containing protein [Aspergillus ambiguus]|uniref:lytic polysaccharide monooxygenase n=1 Tax=Aspergillus ambiguus TaxID=176160 RepID=UPI003CCCA8A8
MKYPSSILALAGLTSMAHGHGFVTTPKARMPGDAMKAACGEQVEINQQSDNYGNVQGELQVAKGQSDFNAQKCDIFLCKGYKFADNKDNVYSYSPGQKVDFVVDIRAPHTGVANVSVVDTASNSVIGSPLKSWKNYASTATGVTDDETNFSVTIPDDLGSQCSEAGACVLQWYWYAQSIDQTYESCVDFTVGGSGSGSGSSSGASSTTAADVAITTTANANNNAASTPSVPTTLATSVRPSTTASAVPTASASGSTSIPTDGSSEEQLNWVASLLRALLKYS